MKLGLTSCCPLSNLYPSDDVTNQNTLIVFFYPQNCETGTNFLLFLLKALSSHDVLANALGNTGSVLEFCVRMHTLSLAAPMALALVNEPIIDLFQTQAAHSLQVHLLHLLHSFMNRLGKIESCNSTKL